MNLKKLAAATGIFAAIAAANPAHALNRFAACNAEPEVVFDGNIVEAAIATPELSTLVTAVTAAGLADALADAEDITVFAPTDDAFAAIPAPVLGELLDDIDALTAVLTYHVVGGAQDPRKWIQPVRRDTLAMQSLFMYRADGEPRVNDAIVDCTGVQTDNGIVWFIDSVLLPQF